MTSIYAVTFCEWDQRLIAAEDQRQRVICIAAACEHDSLGAALAMASDELVGKIILAVGLIGELSLNSEARLRG